MRKCSGLSFGFKGGAMRHCGYLQSCDRQGSFVGRSRKAEERFSWEVGLRRRVQDWRWIILPIDNFIRRRHTFENWFVFACVMEIELTNILFAVRQHPICGVRCLPALECIGFSRKIQLVCGMGCGDNIGEQRQNAWSHLCIYD